METLDTIGDLRVLQPKAGYRFSIDALLLASFVRLPFVRRVADFGAGSGIVGMLLARQYPKASVALIELQEPLAALAAKNVKLNGLDERITVIMCDIREIRRGSMPDAFRGPGTFDLVVSNPPFRRPRTGLISPQEEKAIARHETRLTLHDLAEAAAAALRPRGRLCLVYLPERLADLVTALRHVRLEPKRVRFVHSYASSAAKMVLVEAVRDGRPGLRVEPPCFVYEGRGSYTSELRELCSGKAR